MLSKILHWIKIYRGTLSVAVVGVATLWLVATGQLGLYIHPRYNIFATTMSVIGLLGVALTVKAKTHTKKSRDGYASLFIIALTGFSLILVKPAVLSSEVALQRGVNSSADSGSLSRLSDADIYSPFGDSSLAQLDVKDLSGLISQVQDPGFYEGKNAQALGFITKDEANEDYFFVSRFVVSCCAVDAQPIGIPVYLPGWQDSYQPDQWVEVKGEFEHRNERISLRPDDLKTTKQPEDPYVY